MTLLPQLSDFSFMGKKWGKKRFTGKKWGTFECQSANLQTGESHRFPDSLGLKNIPLFLLIFKSNGEETGKKKRDR